MLHKNFVPSALLLCVLLPLGSWACGPSGKENARTHFAAGSSRELGFETLNASNPARPFYHSFGTVTHGQVFTHTFELRNLEDKTITILRTVPACSCARVKSLYAWQGASKDEGRTAGDLSRKDNILKVEPGQTFSIEMYVDTAKSAPNAGKLAIVRISTDSDAQPFLTFEINFLPEKLFEMASPALQLNDIPLGGGVGNTLQIFSRYALNKARLIDVISTTEGLQADLVLIPGFEANWNLSVTAVDQSRLGPLRGMVTLRTTDGLGQGDAGRLEVPVHGRVVPAIMMYPSNLSFGRVALGKGGSLHAGVQGLAPGHHIKINGSLLEGPSAEYLTVELEKVAEDSFGRSVRIDVHVHCNKNAPAGAIEALLTLDLEDEAQPSIVRKIHGLVE